MSFCPGTQTLQDAGGVEASRIALLSQEGSTIETAVEIVRGGGSRAALFKNAF
jgi:hypothetical protein